VRALLNAARREAAAVLGDVALTSTGIVTSYDPAKYAVRVTLQPQGILTGWIPLGSIWVGNGWGLYCPPSIGDLCEVDFLGGHIGAPVCGLRFYNDQDVPLSVASGEFWLVHKAGQVLKFHNDGTVEISAPGRISYTAASHDFHGPVTMDSTLDAAGTITAPVVDGTTNVLFGGKSGVAHEHGGISRGTAISDPPV